MIRRFSLLPLALALAGLLPTAATADEEVNVYSYRQPDLIKPLLERFTAETGIKANILSIPRGLLARIKEEGELSPADVLLVVDIGRLSNAVTQGITQPVHDPEIEARVPASLRGPEGHWTALTTRARIVYASRQRVAPDGITTYEDLADPRWKGRICTRSGRHQYNIALLAAMIHHHGSGKAEEWLRGIKANLARRPQGNDRAQIKAIWAGECDLSIGNTYYMGKMLENAEQRPWADSVRVTFPTFEAGGTHINVSGVAMAKHAPNPENARRLIRFLVSDAAQQIYAEDNFEYPVNPDVPASARVRAWGSFESDPIAMADIARRRAEALRIVDRVRFDD